MTERVVVCGMLRVYRTGHLHRQLGADVVMPDKTLTYFPAPKCFGDITTDMNKVVWIEFTADAKTYKNPRSVKITRQ